MRALATFLALVLLAPAATDRPPHAGRPRLISWQIQDLGADAFTLAFTTEPAADAEVTLRVRGTERSERIVAGGRTQHSKRFTKLPADADLQVRVVLHAEASSPWLHVVLGDGAEGTHPPVVTRSGIEVLPAGVAGKDFVVEPRWCDLHQDDRVTLWLRSTTALSLVRNDLRDTDPLGGKPTAAGTIRYKLDRDEQAGAYVKGNEGPINGAEYLRPIDLTAEVHPDGRKVLAAFGQNGKPYGLRAMDTTERFTGGLRDAAGDAWHVLTAWDDDTGWFKGGPNGKVRGSDGIVVPMVVDPKTPAIRLSIPDAREEFYTTPAKTYHVPNVFEPVSYVTPRVRVHLYNLADQKPVQYRWGDGPWQEYRQPFPVSRHLHAPDTRAVLETRLGQDGPVRRRVLWLLPARPSAHERHPGPLLWADEAERESIAKRVQHGPEPVRQAYASLRDQTFYNGLDKGYGDGRRRGWHDYEDRSAFALRSAFVCAIEPRGCDYDGGRRALLAKKLLLELFTLEPLGHENTLWWPNPALERVLLGLEQMFFMDAALAYDLLIAEFRPENGHPGGITVLEELKIRDNLAEQAKVICQFRDNCQTGPGEGDPLFGLGMDLALLVIAAAMPGYDSPWFGTSGADGRTTASHKWAPYPDRPVTWWQSVRDPEVPCTGHPNQRGRSRIWVVHPPDGVWSGPKAYETLFFGTGARIANLMKRFAPGDYPFANLDAWLARTTEAGVPLPLCANAHFAFGDRARELSRPLKSQELRDVFVLCYYDPR